MSVESAISIRNVDSMIRLLPLSRMPRTFSTASAKTCREQVQQILKKSLHHSITPSARPSNERGTAVRCSSRARSVKGHLSIYFQRRSVITGEEIDRNFHL